MNADNALTNDMQRLLDREFTDHDFEYVDNQSERLADIGRSLAVTAHESRNELLGLRMGLEQLENMLPDRPDARKLIGRILDAHNRLHRLFENIRGYAAPIRLVLDDHRLEGIWRRAWESLEPQWRDRDAQLNEYVGDLDLWVHVDNLRLEQVFRNLFENSLAACPDTVRIDISCSSTIVNGRLGVQVSICDDGPGLSPHDCRHVFEPFFTTKPEGCGLGMAIAKQIVQSHGGKITAGNNGCRGAAFAIALPRICS